MCVTDSIVSENNFVTYSLFVCIKQSINRVCFCVIGWNKRIGHARFFVLLIMIFYNKMFVLSYVNYCTYKTKGENNVTVNRKLENKLQQQMVHNALLIFIYSCYKPYCRFVWRLYIFYVCRFNIVSCIMYSV